MILLTILLFSLLSSQEIDRRIAIDFNKQLDDLLPYIQKYYPLVDSDQIAMWERSKALEYQVIDGEKWYFRNADANLFRIDDEARRLKVSIEGKEKAGRDTVIMNHVRKVLAEVKDCDHNHLYSKHDWMFSHSISVPINDDLKDGDFIRVWMPAPNCNSKRQTNIKLVSASHNFVLHNDDIIASSFYEDIFLKGNVCNYNTTYSFSTFAEYHRLPKYFCHRKTNLKNKDIAAFLKERAPHCLFSNAVMNLADSIVGDESRPYFQAKLLFSAIRKLFPWASAREYSTIDNIPDYVIENRHGDCGQVTLLYIAMCRYKGIPARWQSGFMLHPGYENLHDWCEIFIEGMGWIPVDPSFGVQEWGATEEERYFYFGGIDAYRLIVNTDWGGALYPMKKFERSENVDFQRGECESSSKNLYFNLWKYDFNVNIIK